MRRVPLTEDLGLAFGVVDLRVGIDGEIYCLEVNLQGQFVYLEFTTGHRYFGAW